MANIIIPPQHQSAPKEPVRLPQNFAPQPAAAPNRPSWDSYDSEMDTPISPAMQKEMAELQKMGYAKPSEAMMEEALKQHELNTDRVKGYRWAGQERWQGRENEEMRKVNIIHPHEFVRRMRRAGISFAFENEAVESNFRRYQDFITRMHAKFGRGSAETERQMEMAGIECPKYEPGQPLFWLNSFVKVGRIGITGWVPDSERGWGRKIETITTLQYPYGPEWSIMRFDDKNLPTAEKYRGWRTALLTMIVAGHITEDQADAAFGKPIGPASLFYREQLYLHRRMTWGIVTQ